jgi:hypothetical protein
MDKEIIYEVGTKVAKTGGDYTFHGEVVAVFSKRSGQVRYVIENDEGILHIFSGKQLSINSKVQQECKEIYTELATLQKRLLSLRDICQHPNVKKAHRSDDDQRLYWTDFTCPDCGKNWIADGSL